MSAKDHKPTDWGFGETRCIWCHEPWPCPTGRLVAEVRRDVAAEIRPQGDEPACCEVHAATWQLRKDLAEEIESGEEYET